MLGFQCVHLNVRSVIFILISFILNGIRVSDTALHDGETTIRIDKNILMTARSNNDGVNFCPTDLECKELHFPCIDCEYNASCTYGKILNATCRAKNGVQCRDMSPFVREWTCRYCYQTDPWEHTCMQKGYCNSINSVYRTNCTVNSGVLCMGHRTFQKNEKCNWTKGKKWSTALLLSITLGGFGVDRFYLGHWQEGIGKIFSFGGLGIWTLIDVILVSLHYLGPADGSLYI